MSFMTKLDGVPDTDQVKPGMAYFEGTGPAGQTCGKCKHRGYSRISSNGTWSKYTQQIEHRTYRVTSCAKFKALAGEHGPSVDRDWKACKYFEAKPK